MAPLHHDPAARTIPPQRRLVRRSVAGVVRRSVDELLETARAGLVRITAEELSGEMRAGALVVDIRPVEQRQRDGELPGAVVIPRNVLEWRLDPTSPDRIPQASDHDRRIVLVCDEGYASSLAAATLQQLGLHRATDLVGGYQAWLAAAERSITPVSPP
jgi:rhodanese-related sulfurtransferase